ncbi:DUF3857 domain-containing transglutaminase family protein [Pedobacter duraquae]|uniref:Transglutaminase superfamily protein n=1 Tax=Pedobacter duraquae TaxID=425511 RepID=A0A4R6IPC1_9SPHI|nr:DUF3857 and transglutaminase domain-containing protein [Pedobacter duraquae]TDO24129.1 transglutaminase superfamily protein [Pedobacter duraquae]
MFKKTLFLLFVGLLHQYNVHAQPGYKASEIPTPLLVRASAVIRNMETNVDMVATDQVIIRIRKTVTILNKNGEDMAGLVLSYNKSRTIKAVKGSVYDADGLLIKKITLSDFEDASAASDFSLYEDERIKHFTPSVNSYPYTVFYEYELRLKQNLVIPDWYANPYTDVAVQKSSYTFSCKTGEKLRMKAYNYAGKPLESSTPGMISYTWDVVNLPALKAEPYMSSGDNFLTYVKVAAENFSYYNTKGTYADWEGLGKWIYNDLIKSRQQLSPATIAEVRELVNGIDDPKEKARKIYQYVQDKTRYVSVQIGIGGYQPISAENVHYLGYGDCKGLVNYTQALLKAAGIPSLYCIVYAGSFKQNLDPEFASMNQANHIILCVPFEKDTTWLECTSQVTPFGYLGDFTDDRTVLACTESGGKLLHTPVLTAEMNSIKRRAQLTVDMQGNITGQMKTIFAGSNYDNDEELLTKPYADQLNLLKDIYDIDNINFEQLKIAQNKGSAWPLTTETCNITIPNYMVQSGNLSYLQLNIFNKTRSIPDLKERKLELYLNRGYSYEDELTFALPENLKIEYQPQNINMETVFGDYHALITFKDHTLIYKRILTGKTGKFPPKAYAEFADFINKAYIADQNKIVLTLASSKK